MFTNRVIGLWIKNIGGRVVRFAHGTSSCFFYETDIPSSIIELFPSTDFIFPTKKFMNFVKSLGNGKDKMLSVILITPMVKKNL